MKQLLFILILLLVLGLSQESFAARPGSGGPDNPEITVLDSRTFALRFMGFIYLLKVEGERIVPADAKLVYRSENKPGPTAGYGTEFRRLNIERK